MFSHVAAMPWGLPRALFTQVESRMLSVPKGDQSLELRDFLAVQPLGAQLLLHSVLPMATQSLLVESFPSVLPRSHWAELGSGDRIWTSVCISRSSSELLGPGQCELKIETVHGLAVC